jgi:hypothetical protein
LDAAIAYSLIQHQWNRCSRSVAVEGEVAEYAFGWNFEPLCDGIKDALVGLMQQQPVEAVWACPSAVEQGRQDCRDFSNSEFVDLLAVHLDRFKPSALMTRISD